MANDSSVLTLSGIGVPDYSARGLNETLTPIQDSIALRRTVNGELQNLSPSQMQKYHLTISGNDQEPPAIDGVWVGAAVTVDCISELSYLTSGGSPSRSVVDGSSRTSGSFTLYRPQLDMLVVNFNVQKDEWGAVVTWTMELEEV